MEKMQTNIDKKLNTRYGNKRIKMWYLVGGFDQGLRRSPFSELQSQYRMNDWNDFGTMDDVVFIKLFCTILDNFIKKALFFFF